MKTGIIYIATNKINGKIYVGQTVEKLEKRIRLHITTTKKFYFSKALNKYGKENFNFGTIEYPIEKLNEMEMYWIKKLDTKIPKGYNLTDGGEGVRGYKYTEEQKKRMNIANRKRFDNIVFREKNKRIQKNRFKDPILRQKLSKIHKERFKDFKIREKNSKAIKKYYENPINIEKNRLAQIKSYKENPERRNKIIRAAKKRFENVEERKKQSNRMKEIWKDEAFRNNISEKMSIASKNAWKIRKENMGVI